VVRPYCTYPAVRRRWSLLPLETALRLVHRPPPDADLEALNTGRHPAQRTLAFEALLAHQLSLRRLRRAGDRDASWPLPRAGERVERFVAGLPFALTAAQSRVWSEF